MKKNLILMLIVVLSTFSLLEAKNPQKSDDIDSYVAFEKLNESMYSAENRDFILGLGIKIKSDNRLNFIVAYEGDIYNKKSNNSFIYPTDKLVSYINGGALSYKLNYKF